MDELFAYRQELFSALEQDITLLARAEVGIPSRDWYRSKSDGQPMPHHTLTRLWVEESQVYSVNLRRILDEDMPLLEDFDVKTWIAAKYDPDVPVQLMIEDLAALRQWEIGLLCGLPPECWSRAARHPRWGVHTLQWWVEQQRDCSHQLLSRLTPLLDL
jgi:hypothetical protein